MERKREKDQTAYLSSINDTKAQSNLIIAKLLSHPMMKTVMSALSLSTEVLPTRIRGSLIYKKVKVSSFCNNLCGKLLAHLKLYDNPFLYLWYCIRPLCRKYMTHFRRLVVLQTILQKLWPFSSGKRLLKFGSPDKEPRSNQRNIHEMENELVIRLTTHGFRWPKPLNRVIEKVDKFFFTAVQVI